jgi:hypothetical protein
MEDCLSFLNQFLELSNYPILKDKGQISVLEAKKKLSKSLINTELFKTKTIFQTLTKKNA